MDENPPNRHRYVAADDHSDPTATPGNGPARPRTWAKYGGTCHVCGGPMNSNEALTRGESIVLDDDEAWVHEDCY